MSSTGRSDVRDPDDHYRTPKWCIDSILPHLPSGGRVLDPGCGSGAILDAIMRTPPFVHEDLFGIELHEGRAEEARALFAPARKSNILTGDFLTSPGYGSYDLIVGNPPFCIAMEFVERALALTRPYRGTVAFLLRLNWLASMERSDFHKKNPCDLFILPRRPSFCASLKCAGMGGKDKGCGWHVVQRLEAPRARECPTCGGKVKITTSDSTEYGWFCWGPNRGNRWWLLDMPSTQPSDEAPDGDGAT